MNLFSDMEKAMEFWRIVLQPPKVSWFSKNEIIYEDDALIVRKFRDGSSGKGVLVIPPQAGHSSIIADMADGKSIIQTGMNNCDHSFFAVEWKSCTYERKDESLDDLASQALLVKTKVLEHVKSIYIIGLCQGGWLSAMLAYLYPEHLESPLITAGSPMNVDVDRELSSVCRCVDLYPQSWYEELVKLGGGMMRGDIMLAGWKAGNAADRYLGDYIRLLNAIDDDLKEKVVQIERDRGWYEYTQNVAGNWYLDVVDNLFRKNKLWNQQMAVHGIVVRLQQLLVDTISVAGGADDITPPRQALALDGDKITIPNTGHIGIYVSKKSQPHWAKIFAAI